MTNPQAMSLYKSLIKEAKKMSSYNFRNYALRKIRDSFRENKELTDPVKIAAALEEGKRDLELLKRQVIIATMYNTEKLVIEHQRK